MIELHNYEEYFLLYADNELTESERHDVEAFVLQYPHLKSELDMIMEAVIKPEGDVALPDKEFLLRFAEEPKISKSNVEAYSILYHDQELAPEQRKQVEEYVNSHAAGKKVFNELAMVKFEANRRIKYPYKSELYRNQKPVIRMFVSRALAAAVLSGVILWGSFSLLNERSEQRMVATMSKEQVAEQQVAVNQKQVSPAEKEAAAASEEVRVSPFRKKNENANSSRPVAEVERSDIHFASHQQEIKDKPAVREYNGLPTEEEIAFARSLKMPPPETAGIVAATIEMPELDIKADAPLQAQPPVQYVSYASNTKSEESEDYIFYNVTFDEFKRTKVGAFLKQVTRVIDRTDPVKLLLSSEKDVSFNN